MNLDLSQIEQRLREHYRKAECSYGGLTQLHHLSITFVRRSRRGNFLFFVNTEWREERSYQGGETRVYQTEVIYRPRHDDFLFRTIEEDHWGW